jgi:hypothetical protein
MRNQITGDTSPLRTLQIPVFRKARTPLKENFSFTIFVLFPMSFSWDVIDLLYHKVQDDDLRVKGEGISRPRGFSECGKEVGEKPVKVN